MESMMDNFNKDDVEDITDKIRTMLNYFVPGVRLNKAMMSTQPTLNCNRVRVALYIPYITIGDLNDVINALNLQDVLVTTDSSGDLFVEGFQT